MAPNLILLDPCSPPGGEFPLLFGGVVYGGGGGGMITAIAGVAVATMKGRAKAIAKKALLHGDLELT